MGSKTKSGTPVESRGAARGAGRSIAQLFQGEGGRPAAFGDVLSRIADPFMGLASGASQEFLGVDPTQFGASVSRLGFGDPLSGLTPLFAALAPFEAQASNRLGRQVAGSFGNLGGRFSANAAQANATGQADLANQFQLQRAQSALGEMQNQRSFLAAIAPQLLNASQMGMGAGLQGLQSILGFAAPGAPVIQPGIGQQLLGAAGTLGGAFLGGPGGAALGSRLFGGSPVMRAG